jgi:hypothetical protein
MALLVFLTGAAPAWLVSSNATHRYSLLEPHGHFAGWNINNNDIDPDSQLVIAVMARFHVTVQVVDAVLSSDVTGKALRCDRMAVTR